MKHKWRVVLILLLVSMVMIMWKMLGKNDTDRKVLMRQHNNAHGVWKKQAKQNKILHVNIWGKAAIAEYLWLHLFEGELRPKPGFMIEEGQLNIGDISWSYTTGPYLVPYTAAKDIQNLIIVLNGRESVKVENAKQWIEALLDKQRFPLLSSLGIILHGNEACNNAWLAPFLKTSRSSVIKFVYVVYDIVDSFGIKQWPLGVATYRNFPFLSKRDIDIYQPRKYKCNFIGTVYEGSSRQTLQEILQRKHSHDCFVKTRSSWQPKESKESMQLYHNVLKNSDLTLCPVGINSESYRIYEAMAYGSIPVLENVMTEGHCDSTQGPFRLLKKYKAPVIYINNWSELTGILEQENRLTEKQIVLRRKEMLDWYEVFRYKLREDFISTVSSQFRE